MTYRPELDGVRGLAILLVLISHGSEGHLTAASFVGVGLFFVLSGYVITGSLLRDRRLGRFYARRVARLGPALIVTLVAVALCIGPHGTAETALFIANWPKAVGWDLGPFEHAWSLGIEEQFYLLWPLLLPVSLRWPRVALTLAVLSAASRFILPTSIGYFATFARMDGLLAGCGLAITGWRARSAWPALAVALALSWQGLPFAWAALAVTLAGVGLVAGTPRILLPLAGLGRISYSLYLYHWPLRFLFGPLGVVLAIPLAYLSTRYLEEPIRNAVGRRLEGERRRAAALVPAMPRRADR